MKSCNPVMPVLALICCLSACATNTSNQGFAPGGSVPTQPISSTPRALVLLDRHLDLVVADLVSAMVQVHDLVPLTTTLQVSEPRGNYGRKLVAALEAAGYGLQWVTADQGDNYLSYENRIIRSDTRDARDFIVTAGPIKLRREYKVAGSRIIPSSILYVTGARNFNNVVLNESLFLQQGGGMKFDSGIAFELADSTTRNSPVRVIRQSPSIAAEDVQNTNLVETTLNRSLNEQSSALLARKDEFRPLRRAKLEFNNDGLVLGRRNKALIKLFLEDFDSQEDALFVSACAAGDEPQEHADEHVTRLKEELILNNVPAGRVVEQGCAPEEYPTGEAIAEHTVMVVQRRLEGNVEAATGPARSLAYPERPLSMTIPHSIGGATDFQARLVTMVAGEQDILGQSIMTINKPGEGGRDGWSWFAETASDSGYDLATYSVPDLIAQSIRFSTQYNIDTMEPIANWGADPVVLAVPASSDLRNLQQFIRYAKRNPGSVTVSGGGEFVGHHIALLQLEKSTNISLDYQPAGDAEEAMHQLEEREVMAGFNDMSDALRHAEDIRILAIADVKRHPALRSVPTFAELGVNIDNSSTSYRGLMVPKGTPSKIINALSEAAIRMFTHPLVLRRMDEANVPLKILNREKTLELWREQQRLLGRFLKNL